MTPRTLDHVALWVADRDTIADFACARLGMHVIERTDKFTLLGADARRGKLTLFAAEGPREQGALARIGLRVAERPEELDEELDAGEGLRIRVVEAPTDVDFDLDHVALFSASPAETAERWEELGFEPAEQGADGIPRVAVGGSYIEFHQGEPGEPERPLLNHLGLLVDSAEETRAEAEERGLEIADFVDAPNTIAVFVWGPERVKVEYVEHKPTFSLA